MSMVCVLDSLYVVVARYVLLLAVACCCVVVFVDKCFVCYCCLLLIVLLAFFAYLQFVRLLQNAYVKCVLLCCVYNLLLFDMVCKCFMFMCDV